MRPFSRKRSATSHPPAELDEIVQRLDRLETMVEGLQDAVYREAQRQDERIDALCDRIRPEQIAKALSDDARRRGL